ncbi:MAG TPA: c-type cytochrome [Kofleriaceae bacterium]|nr:c-type cytochrome [Kofleriaceae bacterium]
MRTWFLATLVVGTAAAGWSLSVGAPGDEPSAAAPGPAPAADGAALYDRFCLACHGIAGDGRGPAAPWLWPRPRAFTTGELKWRSTASGKPATDDDIAAAIRFGVPGTSMHGFGPALDAAQVQALVEVVKGFAPGAYAAAAEPLAIAPGAPVTGGLLARGKEAFQQFGCVQCHGESLKGDGPSAATLQDTRGLPSPPYDLTAEPLRRPRPDAGTARDRGAAAIYASLLTGLSGTPMPSYASLPAADLWAIAVYVDSVRFRGQPTGDRTTVHPLAARLDRTRTGYYPGHGDADATAVWGTTIAAQGPPPAGLAPAQTSPSAMQCARCHMKQVREWRGSLHAEAASPGLIAQLIQNEQKFAWVESCQRCHAPLAEQQPYVRAAHGGGPESERDYAENPLFDPGLRHEGINCASCHVRSWHRFGPPLAAESKLLSLATYPRTESAFYQRSDFCMGCHQLQPRGALAGKPLLNTYREWLEGPYMARGVQCQHCHMPNREHTFKGVHDPDTFRQGIAVEAITGRSVRTGAVSVRARITNAGAGHYLPTTPTPAAWISIELVDGNGKPIKGARSEQRIGRLLKSGAGGWKELEDTRIPPGESLELAGAWKDGRVANATHARVVVRVHPDDYYEGLYESRLRQKKLAAEVRAMFETALKKARASHYVAYDQLYPISPRP